MSNKSRCYRIAPRWGSPAPKAGAGTRTGIVKVSKRRQRLGMNLAPADGRIDRSEALRAARRGAPSKRVLRKRLLPC